MEGYGKRAQRWRERAEELRNIAEELDPTYKRNLLDAADEWLELAERAELAVQAEHSFKVRPKLI
jgi:hypothetical protein